MYPTSHSTRARVRALSLFRRDCFLECAVWTLDLNGSVYPARELPGLFEERATFWTHAGKCHSGTRTDNLLTLTS